MECAQLDLQARKRDERLADMFGAVRDRVPVNAVIATPTPASAVDAALRAVDAGFTCVKLKVGRPSLHEDVAMAAAVRRAVGDSIELRLDANGAWPLERAVHAISALEEFHPEYVEQPLPAADWLLFPELRAHCHVPIAADESALHLARARRMLDERMVDLFVLKPMAMGSLLACRDFAIDAAATGVDVVFTSLLDSALGRTAVAHMCASLQGGRAHGLATGELLREDVGRDVIEKGEFVLPDAPGIGINPLAEIAP
jgi:o-succinylbenzoate synthase